MRLAAPTEYPAHSAARRFGSWVLALAILLQAIWTPFHLAPERHLALEARHDGIAWRAASLRDPAAGTIATVDTADTRIAAGSTGDEAPHEPHIAAAHKLAQQLPSDAWPMATPNTEPPVLIVVAPGNPRGRQSAAAARCRSSGAASAPVRPRAPPAA